MWKACHYKWDFFTLFPGCLKLETHVSHSADRYTWRAVCTPTMKPSQDVCFFVTREQQTVLHSRSSDLWRMGSSWITLCPNFTGKSCYWCSVLALLKAQREKERKSNGNADCIWQRQWEILYITMQHTVLSRKNLARVCQIMLSAPSHVFKKGNI